MPWANQADDGGDPFQGKHGFGSHGDPGEQKIRPGYLARLSFEETRLAGQSRGVQLSKLGADGGEVIGKRLPGRWPNGV